MRRKKLIIKYYLPKYRFYKKVAWVFIILTLQQVWMPTIALALTGGPGQPSFSSFEPVATTNMVNEFTGDFTYNLPILNIPGANGGGYPLSLSYHSGSSPEEESSWVGYGWTLNPGAINRSKRGYPDDYNGQNITYYNQAPSNQTVTIGASYGNVELFSLAAPIDLNLSASLSYNNFKGFSYCLGVGIEYAKGLISLGYSISNGMHSFSAQVNPGAALTGFQEDNGKQAANSTETQTDKKPTKDEAKAAEKKAKAKKTEKEILQVASKFGGVSLLGSNYGIFSHEYDARALQIPQYTGAGFNLSFTIMTTLSPIELGPNGSVSGSYAYQTNESLNTIPAYGYMYSGSVSANQAAMMDYSVEKYKPYTKWDTHLGIPYSGADEFSVTGEGMEGGFRLYNSQAGCFHPSPVKSEVSIYNIGGAVEVGFNNGGGANIGVGFQSLNVTNNWDATQIGAYPFASTYSTNEPYFFDFSDDLGGDVDFGNDAPVQANWTYNSGSYTPSVSGLNQVINNNTRAGRSSYIAYHTNSEMTKVEATSDPYEPYARGSYISKYINRSESDLASGIGEFAVFNQDGTCYSYGLPVYSKNETNLQYSLEQGTVDSNYLAYENITNNSAIKTKVGEEDDSPYATTYLLTSITTPDYIDRKMDGPTDDDYGGWTKFIYRRQWGTVTKGGDSLSYWYHWRSPYTGLLYHPNTLSTLTDDVGSVSSGYKEVYNLDTIETKTHFAVFRTSARTDGYDASGGDSSANNSGAVGPHYLNELDRIDLYSRNNGHPQLIESVHFEYNKTAGLCQGIPNLKGSSSHGKLTLQRVWFEYNGTMNARISPYEFDYAYSTATYPAPYTNDYASKYSSGAQNPGYSYFNLDPWGNAQYQGHARYNLMQNWVNQNPSTSFDPAAWQLKVIKLPSGGEIHIQYEQKDYTYVQDQPAEAMVSLLGPTENTSGNDNPIINPSHKYYLRLHDLGIDSTNLSSVDSVVSMLNTYYVTPKKKIFFKFLYALLGGGPVIGQCNSEYISGYCDVAYAGYKKFTSPSTYYRPYVILGRSGGGAYSNYDLPRNAAIDFYKTQRMGNLNPIGNCDPSQVGLNMNGKSPIDIIMGFLTFLGTAIGGNEVICNNVSYVNSYVRIPLIRAKKGGGVRVRKLLMYDPGIENGDKALYGNEYDYVTESGQSSGVATNEPTSIRDENALVKFDPQKAQTFLQKVICGVDRDMTELPYDETVLPSASIGYSRVVVKNIYSGKTNPGFSVDEYYTAKDYPVTEQNTSINNEKEFLLIPAWIVNYMKNDQWLSQGFSVTLNNMHGQIKSKTTYSGFPSNIPNSTISTQQVYTYFQPGEQIPMMGSPNTIFYSNQGKQSEVVMESRGIEDVDNDISFQFDADVGLLPFPPFALPFFSFVPYYTYTESKLYTHVITKVIHYPALVKSVYSYADGISHTTQNLAFSPTTGKAVLSRTTDGFDQLNLQLSSNHAGSYTSYTFPAEQEYPSMGQRAANERGIISSSANVRIQKEYDAVNNKYYLKFTPKVGQSVCSVLGFLNPGDLVQLADSASGSDYGVYNATDSIVGNNMYLYQTSAFGANLSGYTHAVNVQVIHSGKTNQLSKSAGSFTTYGDTSITNNISQSMLALRQLFAHRLDSAYQANVSYQYTLLPPGLNMISPITGNCVSVDSLNGTMGSILCDTAHGKLTLEWNSGGRVQGIPCTLPFKKGNFGVDPASGQLAFYAPGNQCFPAPVCITFCPLPVNTNMVVQADAQVYNGLWPYDPNIFPVVTGSNLYENGTKGKWRVQSNNVFKDTVIAANGTNRRIYANAGVFPLQLFNWQNTSLNDTTKWIKLNTVTKYSPDGNDLEEEDILGVYSAAKFGYNESQPYLVVKNSNYGSSMFESFENLYSGTTLEDGWVPAKPSDWDTTTGHAGTASWKLPIHDSLNLKPMTFTSQMQNVNLLVKVWVKDTSTFTGNPILGRLKNNAAVTDTFKFRSVARTGAWTLYQATVDSAHFANASVAVNGTFTIYIKNNYGAATNWLDDLRVQPAESEMNAYVYDKKLRLITSFDDQNFGLFYQYNGEGKLVRKQIETLEGIRTVSEAQYHTYEQLRQ